MTDEQTAAKVSALKRERRGYVQRQQLAEKVGNEEEAAKLQKRIDSVDKALTGLEDSDEAVCDECGFEAKSARGLATHQRTHEDDDEE